MNCSLFSKKQSNQNSNKDKDSAGNIVLIPHKQANYELLSINSSQEKSDKPQFGNRFEIVNFTIGDSLKVMNQYRWIEHTCYKYKNSLYKSKYEGQKIIILHIKTKLKNKLPFTIVLSHGKFSDLGSLYPFLIDLSTQMKCDIITYDYSGYGHSEGKPSLNTFAADIEEVCSFASNVLMINPNMMILFGMSIGSIPTIHLGINSKFKDSLRGIILLSPYSSTLFQDSIHSVNCPIFLIHGKKNRITPYEYFEEIAFKIKMLFKWFPSNGNHLNIISKYRYKFYDKMRMYCDELITDYNNNRLNNSFKVNIIQSPDDVKHKIVVMIDEDYADNGNHFEINVLDNNKLDQSKRLMEIIPEEGDKSYCLKENQCNYNDDYYEDYFYENDDSCNVSNDIISSNNILSIQKPKLKSPYITPIKRKITLHELIKTSRIKEKISLEPFIISSINKKNCLTIELYRFDPNLILNSSTDHDSNVITIFNNN